MVPEQHRGQRPIAILIKRLFIGVFFAALGAPAAFAATAASDPAAACISLVNLTNFPITPTQITSAQFNSAGTTSANGVPLPAHCQIDGIINKRIGDDGYPYGDEFEVRLPTPGDWNGRFMFQGGGGTEGSVPPATGTAGTLSPALAHGWAVASQDGGHENNQLPFPNQFFLEPQAVIDYAYRSIDVTTQTAKYLVKVYYGDGPRHSYWVGCSTGGRQGMVMSQNFPDYFDGIVAGDPVYDLEAISLSEDWGVQQIYDITPQPVQRLPDGSPIFYPAFPLSDEQLFTKAILQACDALDGTIDGVIDNLPACLQRFDPSTYGFSDTHQPLQCTGPKSDSCLSKAQIEAVENVNEGPRNSRAQTITAPAGAVAHDPVDNTVFGYQYDGGFMAPSGIPSRKIGTPTTPPGDYSLGLGQLPYIWVQPPDPSFDPLTFNFNSDLGRLNTDSVLVTYSTSLDINRFTHRGGKIIWYHGLSDPGPPVLGTIRYYTEMARQNGGLKAVRKFSRLYPVPNMGHCSGGPATDQFDLLSPLTAWVEQGVDPDPIVASGTNFASPPTTRSRPLCPYPEEARYIGSPPPGGDLGNAANYKCIEPPRPADR